MSSELVKRTDEWVRQFLDGKDIDDIASDAGESALTVGNAVFAVLDRKEANETRAGKARERSRMNRVIAAQMVAADAGDPKAAAVIIKASAELSRLGGSYAAEPDAAPPKGEGSSTDRVQRLQRLLENPEPDLATALSLAGWVRPPRLDRQ